MTIAPDTLSVDAVTTVPVEIDSHPYLTPDGRLLIWFAGTYVQGAGRLAIYDVQTGALSVAPWSLPFSAVLGSAVRAEIYVSIGDEAVAASPSGVRQLPASAECVRLRQPKHVSADGRRLLASCVTALLAIRSYVVDLEANQVIWEMPGFWLGALSADGRHLYRTQGSTITSVLLTNGQTVAEVVGPVQNSGLYLHVEPSTGRLVALGMTEARTYEPGTLQPVTSWPVPWTVPVQSSVSSVASDLTSGLMFLTGGSPIQGAGAPFGDYLVVDATSGAVRYRAPAGARGRPDVGFVVAAPAPAAPASLQATVSPAAAQLSWTASPSTAATTRHVLEVGSAPGLVDIISSLNVGLQTSYSASGVPPGTYYVRVRSGNYTGLSAPSNEVAVTVP